MSRVPRFFLPVALALACAACDPVVTVDGTVVVPVAVQAQFSPTHSGEVVVEVRLPGATHPFVRYTAGLLCGTAASDRSLVVQRISIACGRPGDALVTAWAAPLAGTEASRCNRPATGEYLPSTTLADAVASDEQRVPVVVSDVIGECGSGAVNAALRLAATSP